jgi:glycosyltransferase involved in cell wall biosynthesis
VQGDERISAYWPFLAPRAQERLESGPIPTFSVIIPAYQAAQSIGETIESVLGQTRRPHEIIVCDDGSTDDLTGAVQPYRDQITFLRQENRGAAAAYNAATRAASGEFVSNLDADDVYLPHYFEAVGNLAAARPDLDILTTNAYLEVNGRVIGRYYPEIAKFVVGDQRRGALHNQFIFGLASIRRSRLFEIGGFDESLRLNFDEDGFLRLILGGARAGLVDVPLAIYRLREGSISSSRPASAAQGIRVLEKAESHESLSEDERAYLELQLRAKRAELRLVLAAAALTDSEFAGRRNMFDAAFGELPPGYGARTRAKALLAAVSPRLAARYVGARGNGPGERILRSATRGR